MSEGDHLLEDEGPSETEPSVQGPVQQISPVQDSTNNTRATRSSSRVILGCFVLLVVDVLWVGSSELTEYIFQNMSYSKPYFSTYIKTCMFTLYLFGFVVYRPWQTQCLRCVRPTAISDVPEQGAGTEPSMTEPEFIPLPHDDKSSGPDSDDITAGSRSRPSRTVQFSAVSEVRHLTGRFAEEASIARMSYTAAVRAEQQLRESRDNTYMSVSETARLAAMFCIVWFAANYAYQASLQTSQPGIINVISSTSGLFTLILAAIFPASAADKFTLSKFIAVVVSMSGVVLVSLEDIRQEVHQLQANNTSTSKPGSCDAGSLCAVPRGALWGLGGAALYAVYLTLLNRRSEGGKLSVPMFFGFVGVINAAFLWPGLFILHYTDVELFDWPTHKQWLLLLVNGVLGTAVSEALWLWGCFLTSSLLATMALSLTIPLTMLADVFFRQEDYSIYLYAGSVPVFLCFFAIALLAHYGTWDPVMDCLVSISRCIRNCVRRVLFRLCCCVKDDGYRRLALDEEQLEVTENLLNERTADETS